jgi:hypothetical protein
MSAWRRSKARAFRAQCPARVDVKSTSNRKANRANARVVQNRAYGMIQETLEKRGGPGRTRTCNQTVMSADYSSSNAENTDEFGSFDRDS